MNYAGVVDNLRDSGNRITTVRELIIKRILTSQRPVSAQEIKLYLMTKDKQVNKTTVYRTISFLLEKNIIKEVNLISGTVHYESSFLPHHHHLNCTDCGSVEEIVCSEVENELNKLQSRLSDKKFNITSHALEFYGKCTKCYS